jgi:uncharacterized protein
MYSIDAGRVKKASEEAIPATRNHKKPTDRMLSAGVAHYLFKRDISRWEIPMTATLAEPVAPESTTESSPASTQSGAPAKSRRINNMVWFEVPVTNLARAVRFYEAAFGVQLLTDTRFPGLAMFPRVTDDAVTGAIMQVSDLSDPHESQPCAGGTIVYLNCDGDLDGVLARAKAAGGAILQEVAQLPGNMGYFAQFRDPDGNRVGLHATF